MICTPSVLQTALNNYQGYLPTASEHLRETREKWIPIILKTTAEKRNIRQLSEKVLQGSRKDHVASKLILLSEEHQIAVALCVMQGWAETIQRLPQHQRSFHNQPLSLTQRVGAFLASIPIDHATLAIRNWGRRDGGQIDAIGLICDARVTQVQAFMSVYLAIRAAWDKRGYDWKRREEEEEISKLHTS